MYFIARELAKGFGLETPEGFGENNRPMRRILVLSLSPLLAPSLASAITQVEVESLPSVAVFEGQHAAGMPLGLVAVAAGFVVVGGWLLWISSRSRA